MIMREVTQERVEGVASLVEWLKENSPAVGTAAYQYGALDYAMVGFYEAPKWGGSSVADSYQAGWSDSRDFLRGNE